MKPLSSPAIPSRAALVVRAAVPVLVMVLLLLNAVGMMLGWRFQATFDENRTLTVRPQWTGSVAAYLRALDGFIKDNFPMRKPLILGYNSALYHGFSSAASGKVIIGRDGWIFGADYDSGDGRVESPRLSEHYLARLRLCLEERRDWLAERGIAFMFMFYPTKIAVYGKDNFPSHMRFAPDYVPAGRRVAAYMTGRLRENLVPIEGPILQAAPHTNLYYRTDTHATHQGAFLAIETMLAQGYPGLSFRRYPDYELKPDVLYPTAYGRIMGIPFRETSYVSVPKAGFSARSAALPDPVAATLPAGVRPVVFANPSAGKSRAMLIGDSFTDRMSLYMGELFGSAAIVALNNSRAVPEAKFPLEFIRAYRPDLVLMAYVESRLVDNGRLITEDTVPLLNPDEVRQSRLRRLYRAAASPGPAVLKPFVSNQRTAFEVVPAETPPAGRNLLLEIVYRGDQAIRFYRDPTTAGLSNEMEGVALGPGQRTGYLFLPRGSKGALAALRTDQLLSDPGLVGVSSVWIKDDDL